MEITESNNVSGLSFAKIDPPPLAESHGEKWMRNSGMDEFLDIGRVKLQW